MIEFPRDPQNTIPTSLVKIIGLGGAGANMLDRVVLDGMDGAEMLALNTDIRTLASSVAKERIQLGRNLTKGLGAGGDPELGQQAVLEAETEVRAALKGRKIVFLCVGLGGGTGSGAAPIVSRIAREEGAFVVIFATMPFAFEGRRRREQAESALNELAVLANALVTFDNNRMGELVLAKQGVHEAFSAGDRMISESIKAVIRLVVRPGLIHVGLDELMTALRTTRSRCLFGSGIASGKDRASKALRNALSSPLLDQGSLLKDAETVLVHLCGGQDLTLYEIELLMQSLSKHVPDKAHVLFGAAIDPVMGEALSITLVSALPEERLHARREPVLERPALLDPIDGFDRVEEPVKQVLPEPEAVVAKAAAAVEEEPVKPVKEEEPFGFEAVESEPVVVAKAKEEVHFEAAESSDEEEEAEKKDEVSPFAEAPAPEPVRDHERLAVRVGDPFAGLDDDPFFQATEPSPIREEVKEELEVTGFVPVVEKKPAAGESLEGAPKAKTKPAQPELSFDGGPRGRFEGAAPNLFEGEDLDVPAFLRKRKS